MAKVTDLMELINRSIAIKARIVSYWPQFKETETVDISEYLSPKFNGMYNTNNSTVAFIHENCFYVTRYTRSCMSVLADAGFKMNSNLYVPFSNCDYPRDMQLQWEQIDFLARKEWSEDFVSDCNTVADEKGVSELPAEVLSEAFLMPDKGVKVVHPYFESTYYPICIGEWLSEEIQKQIGTYCSNNGRVCFLDRNGKTYVAKGYKIVAKLQEAGFKSGNLFVPFSNGEVIVDAYLKEAWDRLGKF